MLDVRLRLADGRELVEESNSLYVIQTAKFPLVLPRLHSGALGLFCFFLILWNEPILKRVAPR